MASAPLLALRDVTLCVGAEKPLFERGNLSVGAKERICLVGRNGAGKSSLLKLINSELAADKGEVEWATGVTVAKLQQTIPEGLSGTVYDAVLSGRGEVGELLIEYDHLLLKMEHESSEVLSERFYALNEQIEEQGAWDIKSDIESLLSKMSLDSHQDLSALSGGYIRRVLLAKALVCDPDILLLDEPTNHLDVYTIEWLEKTLLELHKTLIFVSHDRKFLKNIATRIVEIDNGDLISYSGTFDQYLRQKEERLQAEEKANALFDKRLSEEEVWIRQGIKARRTRNEGRVRRLEAMRQERSDRRVRLGSVNMEKQTVSRTGKHIFEIQNISFEYPDKKVLKNFSSIVQKGDKIGILGPNGTGKSTLLKLLMQQLSPTEGKLKASPTLQISYFDQKREQLDLSKSIAENITDSSEMVTIGEKSIHIMTYLRDFLFTPARARVAVKALSGGERHRLLLAKLFTKTSNVLILDEPTNDLDVETLEVLEEKLSDYEGTIIIVSHDRQFLDNVATHLWVFEEEGKVSEYVGGYQDYLNQRPSLKAKTSSKKEAKKEASGADKQAAQRHKKELEKLTKKIEKIEVSIAGLHTSMGKAEFYTLPQEEQERQQSELALLEAELDQAYARWEDLE